MLSFSLNALLFLGLVFSLYRSLRAAFARRTANQEPACAHCRYIVRGLTTPTCPECGSNLLTSGIIPPGRSALSIGRAFGVSFLFLLGLVLASMLVGFIRLYTEDKEIDLLTIGPPDGPIVTLDLYAQGHSPKLAPDEVHAYGFGPSSPPGATTMFRISHVGDISERAVPAGPRATISYLPHTASWLLVDPSRTLTAPSLSDADMDHWLTAIGAGSDLARAHELARMLIAGQSCTDVARFDASAAGSIRHWARAGVGSGSSADPDPTLLLANFWLFAFLRALFAPRALFTHPAPLRNREARRFLTSRAPTCLP